uniref:Uncharacterized protein n=1 Tax=Leersia perrieri TaxID=77586 RepID=A0A0D9VQ97_9ORYZ
MMAETGRKRAAVVVLGDIGRSPRMQYHSLSLANQAGMEVDIVANGGSDPHLLLRENPSIHIHEMKSVQLTGISKISGALALLLKASIQFEKHFGRMADGAFCVTKAMRHELDQNWGINATVLYDQSPEFFHPASLTEKHELFSRLGDSICSAMGNDDCISVEKEMKNMNTTVFTSSIDGEVFLKPNRPALVVSSTSWTPDEDFSILLEAALMYDRRVAATLGEEDSMDERQLWIDMKNGKQFVYPRLLFIITGKGPDKKKYEEQIKRLKLRRVAFRTMWLASEDYPLLLGSADLGVSLHTSSSGLDLPMKMLFKGFPEECNDLKSLKAGALNTGSSSKWSTEWERCALPLVNQVIGRNAC